MGQKEIVRRITIVFNHTCCVKMKTTYAVHTHVKVNGYFYNRNLILFHLLNIALKKYITTGILYTFVNLGSYILLRSRIKFK